MKNVYSQSTIKKVYSTLRHYIQWFANIIEACSLTPKQAVSLASFCHSHWRQSIPSNSGHVIILVEINKQFAFFRSLSSCSCVILQFSTRPSIFVVVLLIEDIHFPRVLLGLDQAPTATNSRVSTNLDGSKHLRIKGEISRVLLEHSTALISREVWTRLP